MIAKKSVRHFVGDRLVSVAPDTDIHEAIDLLVREQISGAPVIDEMGGLVGFLSEKDCFKIAFSCCYYADRGGRVADYMTQSVVTVDANEDVIAVAEMFMKGRYRRFPVIAGGRVVGVISRRDALQALLELC